MAGSFAVQSVAFSFQAAAIEFHCRNTIFMSNTALVVSTFGLFSWVKKKAVRFVPVAPLLQSAILNWKRATLLVTTFAERLEGESLVSVSTKHQYHFGGKLIYCGKISHKRLELNNVPFTF